MAVILGSRRSAGGAQALSIGPAALAPRLKSRRVKPPGNACQCPRNFNRMDDSQQEVQEQETPVDHVFRPPSIDSRQVLSGTSYSYYSVLPSPIATDENVEYVLGI